MIEYRITKYDPQKRDKFGRYLDQEEWTCFSEVGTKLTLEEYEEVEKKYIAAALSFHRENIDKLKVQNVENHLNDDTSELSKTMTSSLFKTILQNVLRNKYWCTLESEEGFVHIGWDYYMYIGCEQEKEDIIKEAEEKGLFVEKFNSPYKNEGR
jgi:hypothetical protein